MADPVKSTKVSAKDLVERLSPQGVKVLLTELRADGVRLSDKTIAEKISTFYGVTVTEVAIRQWRRDEGVA